jgi:YHS domain-containing protein
VPANVDDLTKQIDEKLAAADDRLQQQWNPEEEEARPQRDRLVAFLKQAADLLRDEIAPRMRNLTGDFPNAGVSAIDSQGTCEAKCAFRHSPRFPAMAPLTVGCAHDDQIEQFLCYYDLEILPVYSEFQKHEQTVSPLESQDGAALLKWIDDKIVPFLETDLRLEFVDHHQRENRVIDPVGQRRWNLSTAAAKSPHNGKSYFFRTDENRKQLKPLPKNTSDLESKF